jgi:putative GTP pyrophosphokinase
MDAGTPPESLTEEEARRIADVYAVNLPLYDNLAAEAKFVLDKALPESIKIHTIDARVKELGKVIGKVERKHYHDPFSEMHDLVGLRVVCLFLNDIEKIATVIREEFDVVGEENKIDDESDNFGYMALHFDVRLPRTFSGARYDDLREFVFEIQVRTLLMDAWANVSHYLDYKRESSIPSGLRRDFVALSGLFYVADQHFEMFMRSSRESQRRAESDLSTPNAIDLGAEPLDADTLYAYLARRYPKRNRTPRNQTSELAGELIEAGLTTLADVEAVLEKAEADVFREEKEDRPKRIKPFFTGVGVLRGAARRVVPGYTAVLNRHFGHEESEGDDQSEQADPSERRS